MLDVLRELLNKRKKLVKGTNEQEEKKDTTRKYAKERLGLLLVQDRASISADFVEIMKQDIVKVIQKYVIVDENTVEIEMINSITSDGQRTETGFVLKAPIINVKNEMKPWKVKKTEEIVEELRREKSRSNRRCRKRNRRARKERNNSEK